MNVFKAVRELFDAVHAEKIRGTPGVPDPRYGDMQFAMVAEEFEELKKAHEAGDVVQVADGLADLIYVAVGLGITYGIPLEEVFAEVQRTNMAKFPGGVVKRRPDGKVLKPDGWKPPDIVGILERHGMR